MIQIKKTKSVVMNGDEDGLELGINGSVGKAISRTGDYYPLFIPMKSVFQIKRGLESYIQKFYRRKVK